MEKNYLLVFLFLLLSSCSSFEKVKSTNVDELLNSIKVTGEGKGRISTPQGQHLFSCDAILKEDHTWILSIMIPLQGEELMILPQLEKKIPSDQTMDKFEWRIGEELKKVDIHHKLKPNQVIQGIHSMLRFVLGRELKLPRDCFIDNNVYLCDLENEKFIIEKKETSALISYELNEDYKMVLVAENLTNSFFGRTSFYVISKTKNYKFDSIIALEFFWK
jgi:hypothetical protein